MVTPTQRYHNARCKARILDRREFERFMRDGGYCEGTREQECMIDALRLAYEAGVRDGANTENP